MKMEKPQFEFPSTAPYLAQESARIVLQGQKVLFHEKVNLLPVEIRKVNEKAR